MLFQVNFFIINFFNVFFLMNCCCLDQPQTVSLQAPSCVNSRGIPAHELIHALGKLFKFNYFIAKLKLCMKDSGTNKVDQIEITT